MHPTPWEDLPAGAQLGNLEYTVDGGTLAEYRALVGDGGHYPNLLADDCRALLTRRCGSLPVATRWRRLEFLRPPVLGRRVQVGGWLREVEEDDGGVAKLRVAAFAVDEIGTEILRSEAVFSIGEDPTPSIAGAVEDIGMVAPAAGDDGLAGIGPGDALALGALVLPSGAEPTALIAGWLEAAIGRRFGEDWRWGGRMALAYPDSAGAGAGAGDVLDAVAVVTGRDRLTGGALDWRLAVSVGRRGGVAVVVGDCGITTPSPRRL